MRRLLGIVLVGNDGGLGRSGASGGFAPEANLVIPASVLQMRLAQAAPAPSSGISKKRWIVIALIGAGVVAMMVAIQANGQDRPGDVIGGG